MNVYARVEEGVKTAEQVGLLGRARGGTGWVAWFGKLPWGDPSVAAQVLGMLMFCAGGIGGLITPTTST